MNKKCHTLYGSSTTACSFKILCGERANELGRTQGETERRQKFLRTIFAFITLETTKVIRKVLPSAYHLLFYDGPCDLSVASSYFDDTQISFFLNENAVPKIFFAAPLYLCPSTYTAEVRYLYLSTISQASPFSIAWLLFINFRSAG